MPIVVAMVALVVILAGSAWAMRRRSGGDAHSVEGYRQTLDTLQGLGSHRPPSATRLVDADRREPEGRGPHGRQGVAPPAGRRRAAWGSGRSGPSEGRGLAFEDRAATAPPRHLGVDRGRATWPGERRPRRQAAVAALLAVVVAAGAAVYLTGRSHHPSVAAGARASGSSRAGTRAGTGGSHGHAHHTAPTVPPLRYLPVTSTATTASYTTPTATYALGLSATSGNCWIQVTDAAGTTVFAQTLSAGTSHTLTVQGKATVNIGAPSVVNVSVDHAPVVFPTGYRGPFTMTFMPAPAAAGGTTSTPAT